MESGVWQIKTPEKERKSIQEGILATINQWGGDNITALLGHH